jgi:uncharacterized BrkB/YihY/UPF0761 family membrane protein
MALVLPKELSNRAGAISLVFFMALFPFRTFILNLIPIYPEGFKQILKFVEGVCQIPLCN